jgi:DNA-directed RNA polymerase specialized sigma24 family protein
VEESDLLQQLRSGRREALDDLTVLLHSELREIAHRHRALRDDASTLPTTAIVHEAYFKLVDQSCARWNVGGLTNDEIGEALGITPRTVEREWAKARLLLRQVMES